MTRLALGLALLIAAAGLAETPGENR